ncbi:MAG: hypothetical protein ABR538_13960 [Candidatus Binatia bacterium]
MDTRDFPGSPARGPAFPQQKAFVLQFAAEAGPETGVFRGRVQHVASGEQASFRSLDELWAFVRGILLESLNPPPALSAAAGEDA